MSKEEKKVNHHDGEGGGGCFGGCAGCLVLLVAGAVVTGMLILTPYLRDRNWTKEGIQEFFYDRKARIKEIFDEFSYRIKDTIKHPSSARENMQGMSEQFKDTGTETQEQFPGASPDEPALYQEPAPQKSGTEEPNRLPGAETPNLNVGLIED